MKSNTSDTLFEYAVIATVAFLFWTCVLRPLWIRRTASTHVSQRTEQERALDAQTRKLARQAALQRHIAVAAEQPEKNPAAPASLRKRRVEQRPHKKLETKISPPQSPRRATTSELMDSFCQPVDSQPISAGPNACQQTPNEPPVETPSFYHMSGLPMAETSAAILYQLSEEFMPIIKRRRFRVSSVSEMCCCGDGILEHGSPQQYVRPDEKHLCGHGYNCIKILGHGRTSHSIHLRLRHPEDHQVVLGYDHAVDVMCHELAHCKHSHHTDTFYKLVQDIKDEHTILQSRDTGAFEEFLQTEQEFKGFNVYRSTMVEARS